MNPNALQRVMIIDDEPDFAAGVRRILVANGIRNVSAFTAGLDALDSIGKEIPDVIVLDMVMPGISGFDLLSVLVEKYPAIPVVVLTAVNEVDNIVRCMKAGAFDYLTKPVNSGRLLATLGNAFKLSDLNRQNRQMKDYLLGGALSRPENFQEIIATNSRMKSIFKLVETVAPTLHPVLVTGETGTGKELLAQALHRSSGVKGAFVPVDLGGLGGNTFIDTIFGHCKGAHGSSTPEREGLIRKAENGTLLLDEIGDLSTESQQALLRLLQEGEYYRPGSDMLCRSTARIIAATNRDMNELIGTKKFRTDLYHRLRTHHLHLPPLRERTDDIPLLLRYFLEKETGLMGREAPEVTRELLVALKLYEFPGNVRELLNMVKHALAMNPSNMLTLEDFPEIAAPRKKCPTGIVRVSRDNFYTLHGAFGTFPTINEVERLLIDEALKEAEGNKSLAAELLGISRTTLHKKLVPDDSGTQP